MVTAHQIIQDIRRCHTSPRDPKGGVKYYPTSKSCCSYLGYSGYKLWELFIRCSRSKDVSDKCYCIAILTFYKKSSATSIPARCATYSNYENIYQESNYEKPLPHDHTSMSILSIVGILKRCTFKENIFKSI